MDETGWTNDENNNLESAEDYKNDGRSEFVERHLELNEDDFLIIPNGGSGDCMFKAVSQAIHTGDESKHREIRKQVVDFIINEKWEKFSESIEVQHINGNNLLERQWAKDPKHTYKMYMTLAGTLGSSSELTAAGELYNYNFATIQEYCTSGERTYRVENCVLSEDIPDFHYFYFTGDYDNGHWEYIRNLSTIQVDDGIYRGRHKIMIEGEETSVEEWLIRNTANQNDADRLKIPTDKVYFARRRTLYPFDLSCFNFGKHGVVALKGVPFTLAQIDSTDLFSVIAQECLHSMESAEEVELVLMKHRFTYFEDINYKLITQPWSNNLTLDVIKYCGYPCKGNIQDLISAADLYSFSFVLFLKLNGSEDDKSVHECKFVHVDRWGGESDRIMYFFMRLTHSPSGAILPKWWRLLPIDGANVEASRNVLHNKPFRTSRPRLRSSDGTITADSIVDSKVAILKASRPVSAKGQSNSVLNFRENHVHHLNDILDVSSGDIFRSSSRSNRQVERYGNNTSSYMSTDADIDDGDADESVQLQNDYETIFGPRENLSRKSSFTIEKASLLKNGDMRLVKKKLKPDKLKPATDEDLRKHPDKVKTVVTLSDRRNSGREIIYRGDGYMEAFDVLTDLGTQGLIKLPQSPASSAISQRKAECRNPEMNNEFYFGRNNFQAPIGTRDENFNVVDTDESHLLKRNSDNEDSEISFEKFGPGAFDPNTANNVKPIPSRDSQEQQFLSNEFSNPQKHDHSKIRRNKVSPTINDISQSYMQRRCKVPEDDRSQPDQKQPNVCFRPLRRILAWISSRLSKMSRVMKKGLHARYNRFRTSKSLIKVTRTKNTFRQSKDNSM